MQVQSMQPGQVFVTAGGLDGSETDKAWFVTGDHQVGKLDQFSSNHEEADTRVWFHALKFEKSIIYSPDTDTFMIGLPLVDPGCHDVVVRVDTPAAKDRL